MNENKTNTAEVIGEEQLEHVSGGTSDGKTCWFQSAAEGSAKVEWKHGAYRMWCTHFVCNSGCACHGTDHCVKAWHWISQTIVDPQLKPAGHANHNAKNKTGISNSFRDPDAK